MNDKVERALERLEERAAEAEDKANRLEGKLSKYERSEEWLWTIHRYVEAGQDVDLPVPRLEMREEPIDKDGYRVKWTQFLVFENFPPDDDVLLAPLGYTTTSSGREVLARDPELPYRDGAHIYHNMAQLKLPGFLTRFNAEGEMTFSRELQFSDPMCRPSTKKKFGV